MTNRNPNNRLTSCRGVHSIDSVTERSTRMLPGKVFSVLSNCTLYSTLYSTAIADSTW